MLLSKFCASLFPLEQKQKKPQTVELFSVAGENKQMPFLNVSGMHHHNDTSIMFQCSVCMSVCWSGNTLSTAFPPPLCCCWLIVTAPESAACLRYSHTHLPLLVASSAPGAWNQEEVRWGSSSPPGVSVSPTCPVTPGRQLEPLTINWLVDRQKDDRQLFS